MMLVEHNTKSVNEKNNITVRLKLTVTPFLQGSTKHLIMLYFKKNHHFSYFTISSIGRRFLVIEETSAE